MKRLHKWTALRFSISIFTSFVIIRFVFMSSAAFNSLPESLSLPFFLLANVCVCVIELRLPIGASGTAVCWIYQWHRIWSANINRTCIFANSAQCLQGNFGMTCNRSVPTAHCPPQKNFIRFWCYVARNVDSQRFCCKNSTTAFNSIFFFFFSHNYD